MTRLNAHFEAGSIEPNSSDLITVDPALDKAKVVKPIAKSEQIFSFLLNNKNPKANALGFLGFD
jgi:hypothetical protein